MTRRDQTPFVQAPGTSRQEIRNPERIVCAWVMGCAVLAWLLVMMGII